MSPQEKQEIWWKFIAQAEMDMTWQYAINEMSDELNDLFNKTMDKILER